MVLALDELLEIADFNKSSDGLIPALIQHYKTSEVLMLGYMDQTALKNTLKSGKVVFFSRSRKRLWTKGEESGNFLFLKNVRLDCDHDTILIFADPAGPVCHTGAATCFGNAENKKFTIEDLEQIISNRKASPLTDSYTSQLFSAGINKIAQKVGEETVELIIEAKDQNGDLFLNEAADLLFHYLVLLREKDYCLDDVLNILKERNQPVKLNSSADSLQE